MSRKAKIGIGTLLVQLIIFRYLKANPELIEHYFIPYVFYPVSTLLTSISNLFPFSVGLVLIYVLGAVLLLKLVKWIKRLKSKEAKLNLSVLNLFVWISPLYFYYMVTWGLLYHRVPVWQHLGYDTSAPTRQELIELAEDMIFEINDIRGRLSDEEVYETDFKTMAETAVSSINNLDYPFLKEKKHSVKRAFGSVVMAYFSTTGIYTFWTGEANVSKILINPNLPNAMLHELAHQKGVASEDEASYVAWLAAKDHPDLLFRYSAYWDIMWRAMNLLYWIDYPTAVRLYHRITPDIYKDNDRIQRQWAPYENTFQEQVVWPIYDIFLKVNGEEYGAETYNYVLNLVIYERRNKK